MANDAADGTRPPGRCALRGRKGGRRVAWSWPPTCTKEGAGVEGSIRQPSHRGEKAATMAVDDGGSGRRHRRPSHPSPSPVSPPPHRRRRRCRRLDLHHGTGGQPRGAPAVAATWTTGCPAGRSGAAARRVKRCRGAGREAARRPAPRRASPVVAGGATRRGRHDARVDGAVRGGGGGGNGDRRRQPNCGERDGVGRAGGAPPQVRRRCVVGAGGGGRANGWGWA